MSENSLTNDISHDRCKRTLEVVDSLLDENNKKLCTSENNTTSQVERLKRRKVAIVLGYNGRGYHGMQINKMFKTIELELFQALHKVGLITEFEILEPYLLKFQRAARTDKSVSAAKQVVSLCLNDINKVKEINDNLSPNIRVFSMKRVTKGFDSKGNCDARTYSYILPTQVLSEEPLDNFLETEYRITPELIKKINDILNIFVGTHNFHNFTSRRYFGDPSSKRYIMSFNCGEPFIHRKEFVILTVKGQSFMLHQIRKMVGTVIAVARGLVTTDVIQTAFLGDKIKVPQAPGEGLFLETPHFDKYDNRYGNDGIHEKLMSEDVEEEIVKFREQQIVIPMVENELENQTIIKWVQDYVNINNDLFQKEVREEAPQKSEVTEIEGTELTKVYMQE